MPRQTKVLTEKKQRTYLLVSMAENEEREVQDVLDEVDELLDPLLDDLDIKMSTAHNVKLVSQGHKTGCKAGR